MTYEQQLIEEATLLSDLLNQFTPQQIASVKRVREVFRYLKKRKEKADKAFRDYNWRPGKQ